MSEKRVRGLLGFLIDVLSWLRMYKQRDFWIQIAVVLVGVFLWVIFDWGVGAIAAVPILALLNFIMTNIVWAISRRQYSCVVGGCIGYGLYNFAVGAVVYHQSLAGTLVSTLKGMAYGLVFTWFAFAIFYFIGLIKIGKKKKEGTQSQSL